MTQKILVDLLEQIKNQLVTPGAPTATQGPWINLLQQIADNWTADSVAPGVVRLATDTEATTGTATDIAVTPANLAAVIVATGATVPATATEAGIIEMATDAETITGTAIDRALTPANLQAMTASATRDGIVELATDAETQTGSATDRAITPANLSARTATATRTGVVELATAAEALAGSDTDRAVTPAGLAGAILHVELIAFAGAAAAGACTATGLKTSDVILSVTGIAAGTVGDQSANFEAVVTVNDQIQQSAAGNLSANIYHALVYRQS